MQTKIMKIFLGLILLVHLVNAKMAEVTPHIKITDFKTAIGIDINSKELIGIENRFDSNIDMIYASATVHNIFPSAIVNIKWYRVDDNNSIDMLYQKDLQVKGTMPIFSAIKAENKKFSLGKYFIDISYKQKVVARTSFEIVTKSIKKKECIEPTKADNRLLVKDMLKLYPTVGKEILSMGLVRLVDPKNRFSLIAPNGWERDKTKKVLLYLYKNPKSKRVAVYYIQELPLEKRFLNILPKVLIEASSEVVQKQSIKTGAKVFKKAKIYSFSDIIVSYFELLRRVNGVKLWELHTLIYDGKYQYDIAIMVDKNSLKLGHFLSELALYSFWTRESCKK